MFVITMLAAPITSAHTRANVMMDLMVMVSRVTTVTNVAWTHPVTKAPFVSILLVTLNVIVVTDILAMALSAEKLTTLQCSVSSMALGHALMDIPVMNSNVMTSTNVMQSTHVTPMHHVPTTVVHMTVNVIMDTLVMVLNVET